MSKVLMGSWVLSDVPEEDAKYFVKLWNRVLSDDVVERDLLDYEAAGEGREEKWAGDVLRFRLDLVECGVVESEEECSCYAVDVMAAWSTYYNALEIMPYSDSGAWCEHEPEKHLTALRAFLDRRFPGIGISGSLSAAHDDDIEVFTAHGAGVELSRPVLIPGAAMSGGNRRQTVISIIMDESERPGLSLTRVESGSIRGAEAEALDRLYNIYGGKLKVFPVLAVDGWFDAHKFEKAEIYNG